MAAFAQRCCGKDTKRRTGSLKVYRFLTKPLMKRALSLLPPSMPPAPYRAKRRQNPFTNMAAASFRNRKPSQCVLVLRTGNENRAPFSMESLPYDSSKGIALMDGGYAQTANSPLDSRA